MFCSSCCPKLVRLSSPSRLAYVDKFAASAATIFVTLGLAINVQLLLTSACVLGLAADKYYSTLLHSCRPDLQ